MNLRTHPNWVTRKSSLLANTISNSYNLINLKGVVPHISNFTRLPYGVHGLCMGGLGVSGFRDLYFLLDCFKCTLNFIRFRCTMNLFLIKNEYQAYYVLCYDHGEMSRHQTMTQRKRLDWRQCRMVKYSYELVTQ